MIIVLGRTISIFRLDWPIRDHSSVCCLVMSGICSRVVTALITDRIVAFLAPWPGPVSPSTGHFVSHPGVTLVTTHTRCERDMAALMQYADTLSPPAVMVFVPLSTHRQHHHQQGARCQEHRRL